VKSTIDVQVTYPDVSVTGEIAAWLVSQLKGSETRLTVLSWAVPTTFVAVTAGDFESTEDALGVGYTLRETLNTFWSRFHIAQRRLRWREGVVEIIDRDVAISPSPQALEALRQDTEFKARYEANFKQYVPMIAKTRFDKEDLARGLGLAVGQRFAAELALSLCASDEDAACALAIAVAEVEKNRALQAQFDAEYPHWAVKREKKTS